MGDRSMTKFSPLAGIATLSLLAGCGEQAQPPVNITTVEVDNSTNVTVPSGNAAEPAPANAVEAKEAVALALAPDGLTVVIEETGSTRHANFGMDRDVIVPMVSASLGKPTSTGRNEECGQGPMDTVVFEGGLTTFYMDGKFVGWDAGEKGGFTTMNGIGIGSTLKELRGAFSGVTVETSSLGEEFAAGDMGGLLTSLKPDAKITAFWAGSTCQFR